MLPRLLTSSILALVPLVALGVLSSVTAGAQPGDTALLIDAGPDGNQPTSVGEIEDCVSVEPGAEFDVDVIIQEVRDLLAWEVPIGYDPAVLTVVDHDVKLFQAANEGSSPIDISARVPDDSGFHELRAFESSDPPMTDSGTGVLARLTFQATAAGESEVTFGTLDINDDGVLDRATLLKDEEAEVIGDDTGDDFFDGETQPALVVVGEDCPAGTNAVQATAAGGSGSSSFPWLYFGAAVAGVLTVTAVAGTVLMSRRQSAVTPTDPTRS